MLKIMLNLIEYAGANARLRRERDDMSNRPHTATPLTFARRPYFMRPPFLLAPRRPQEELKIAKNESDIMSLTIARPHSKFTNDGSTNRGFFLEGPN